MSFILHVFFIFLTFLQIRHILTYVLTIYVTIFVVSDILLYTANICVLQNTSKIPYICKISEY